jgi:hypothetical protein
LPQPLVRPGAARQYERGTHKIPIAGLAPRGIADFERLALRGWLCAADLNG